MGWVGTLEGDELGLPEGCPVGVVVGSLLG